MAAFVKYDITAAGRNLIAKGASGKLISYTRIAVGDGELLQAQDPGTMTALVNEVLSIGITSVELLGNGQVRVRGAFSNADLTVGFLYREIGLYATDPDSGLEVLYCYGNAVNQAEWIPPSGTATAIEKIINVVTTIGSAANVTAVIHSGTYLTVEDFSGAIAGYYTKTEVDEQLANKANKAPYSGENLTVKFAADIAGYSDVWAWIKARIQAANFTGIHVGDYIPFAAGGNAIKAEVAGVDTYYNYGDTAIGHHIDFISRDCWPDTHVFNKVNYNNGTSVSPHPWLASDLYAWLNSLSMDVPNATTANPALVSVDYTATGVYDKLPTALKSVIAPKRLLLPLRYTAGSLLTEDNTWSWADAGNLWIPSEIEVYGCEHWGSKNGYSSGGSQQYELFSANMKRVKGAGDGGGRTSWWLLSARGGSYASFAPVAGSGDATNTGASSTNLRVPVCFRIA